ncbi:MAG: hypothetical protein ACHQIO_03005 [Nevskiales bacterium]
MPPLHRAQVVVEPLAVELPVAVLAAALLVVPPEAPLHPAAGQAREPVVPQQVQGPAASEPELEPEPEPAA